MSLKAWALMTAVAAQAQPGILDDADAAYRQYDFARAQQSYQAALSAGGLSRADLVRAYAGLALASAVGLDSARAQWAFERLLSLEPTWSPPRDIGPKLREPFERASNTGAGRLRLELGDLPTAAPGRALTLHAVVQADRTGLVSTLRLHWTGPTPEERVIAGASADFEVPASAVVDGLGLEVEALDDKGSVVAEAPSLTVHLERPRPSRLHLGAAGFFVTGPARIGAEVFATLMIVPALELGLGAKIGQHVAGQLTASLIYRRESVIEPFLQPRLNVAPSSGGVVVGAGAALGIFIRLGIARLSAAVAGEGYFGGGAQQPPVVGLLLLGADVGLF